MNPIPAAFLVGVIVVIRKWSEGKPLDPTNAIGVAGLAVTLAVVSSMNKQLGRAFGLLAVLGVGLAQAPRIIEDAGVTNRGIENRSA